MRFSRGFIIALNFLKSTMKWSNSTLAKVAMSPKSLLAKLNLKALEKFLDTKIAINDKIGIDKRTKS
jgi:hypothetical protein